MNNRVYQSDGTTYINIGDWYLGIYLHEDGEMSIYIDSDKGKVMQYDLDISEDDPQWARRFFTERRIATKELLRRKMTIK